MANLSDMPKPARAGKTSTCAPAGLFEVTKDGGGNGGAGTWEALLAEFVTLGDVGDA